MSAQGVGVRAIGRTLGLDRKTVRKYLNMQGGLHYAPRPKRRSLLDPYADYLLKRWQDGCENAAVLFREIEMQGYRGSATTVRDFVASLRTQASGRPVSQRRPLATSPRQLRWLLARDHKELGQEEQEDLQRLLDTSTEMQHLYALLQSFLRMVRQREPERLRPWMEEAESIGIPELKSFVAGVERDYDAVKAALQYPWSQGVTEGFINKLKTLKRMMYGRAGFELLRRRMLLAA
jgi:transposase